MGGSLLHLGQPGPFGPIQRLQLVGVVTWKGFQIGEMPGCLVAQHSLGNSKHCAAQETPGVWAALRCAALRCTVRLLARAALRCTARHLGISPPDTRHLPKHD